MLGLAIGGFQIGGPNVALGCVTGIIYGVLAIGLILVYRQSRVINFAYGEIGAFGATFVGLAVVSWHWPYWAAFPLGLALSAIVGAASEILVIRRLRRAPLVISVVATLGLGQFIDELSGSLNTKLQAGSTFPQPPGLPRFHLGALLITPAYSGMVILTPVLALALVLFLRRSRLGLAMRAASTNPDAADLAGVRPGTVSAMAWAIAGALAAFTATLVLPTRGFSSGSFLGPELLMRALAAAVVARMVNMPIALGVGVGIGIVEQLILANEASSEPVSAVLFVVILVALLLQRNQQSGRRDEEKGVWAAVRSYPPVPAELNRIFAVRNLNRFFCLAVLAVGIILPQFMSGSNTDVLIVIVSFATIGLSVSIITGLAGQLSLGQFAIAGIGATAAYVVSQHTSSVVLSLLIGAAAAALGSLVIGLPALRIRGIMLGVTTLAFALAAQDWLFNQKWMLGTGVVPGVPQIGHFRATTPRSYYYFSVGALVLCFWLVRNIWRGNVGRRVKAVRDNEDSARAFGLRPTSVRLQAFILSGFIAGLGGVLVGESLSYLEPSTFTYQSSLDVAAMAVVGGLGIVMGPIIGCLYIVGIPQWVPLDSAGLAATALGWLVLIVQFPGGFAQSTGPTRTRLVHALARLSGRRGTVQATDLVTETVISDETLPTVRRVEGHRATVETGTLLLTASGLSKRYGGIRAVDDVSLEVRVGETVGLIGPNGAGKTTLFELLSGFAKPDSGRVIFGEHDVTRLPADRRARLGLVRSFQDVSLFPTMTVTEVLMVSLERTAPTHLAPSLIGLSRGDRKKRQKALELIDSMGLSDYAERPISQLSTGTRRIVELACLVALEPSLLLLDEPSAGIAQRETENLGGVLESLRDELNLTLVIIEHDIPLLMSLADRVIAMESGRILAEGSPDAVRSNSLVIESYLGGDLTTIERSDYTRIRGTVPAEVPVSGAFGPLGSTRDPT